jgi:chromosome segregation ATPase
MEDPENSIAQSQAKLNAMTALLCDSMAEVRYLHTRLQEVEARFQEVEARLQEVETELLVARYNYGTILNSTSWRVTAPLRSLMQMIHRGR